jgi:hypothetical protein
VADGHELAALCLAAAPIPATPMTDGLERARAGLRRAARASSKCTASATGIPKRRRMTPTGLADSHPIIAVVLCTEEARPMGSFYFRVGHEAAGMLAKLSCLATTSSSEGRLLNRIQQRNPGITVISLLQSICSLKTSVELCELAIATRGGFGMRAMLASGQFSAGSCGGGNCNSGLS